MTFCFSISEEVEFVIKCTLIPSMEMLTLSCALPGMGIVLREGSLVGDVSVLGTLGTGGVKLRGDHQTQSSFGHEATDLGAGSQLCLSAPPFPSLPSCL